MREQIKIEYERVIHSKTMWVALFIGLTISIAQFIAEVIPAAKDPLEYFKGTFQCYPWSVFNNWMGGRFADVYSTVFLTVLPVLATLAHGITYYMDIKSGYIKNIYTRTTKKNYLAAKYIVTFISGGIVVIIPWLVNLLLTACVLPSLVPVGNGMFSINGGRMLDGVYYTHTYLYIMIYLGIYFLYAGVFSTVALAGAYIIENIFLLTLLPFIVYYGIAILSPYLKHISWLGRINPVTLLDMTQPRGAQPMAMILELVIAASISGLIYFRNGVKKDAF